MNVIWQYIVGNQKSELLTYQCIVEKKAICQIANYIVGLLRKNPYRACKGREAMRFIYVYFWLGAVLTQISIQMSGEDFRRSIDANWNWLDGQSLIKEYSTSCFLS